MTVLDGVQQMLWANASFRAVSPGGLVRVEVPEGASFPITTFHIVGGNSKPTFDTSGMQRLRVQFDARAVTYAAADAVRTALIQLLNGFRGALPNGVFLQQCQLIQPIDYFDNDARTFRCGVEFYFDFTTL